MFLILGEIALVLVLVSTIFLPVIMKSPEFPEAGLVKCEPNAGVTYVDGYVYQGETPINGNYVAFGTSPSGQPIARIQAGPHPGYPNWQKGFFSHILSATGPRAGNWYFWIESQAGERLSVVVPVVTTATADPGGCQQAHIFFRKP